MAHAVHAVQQRVEAGSIAAQDVTESTLEEELFTQVSALHLQTAVNKQSFPARSHKLAEVFQGMLDAKQIMLV